MIPCKLDAVPWSVVTKGNGSCLSLLPPSLDFQLANRFDILSVQEFPLVPPLHQLHSSSQLWFPLDKWPGFLAWHPAIIYTWSGGVAATPGTSSADSILPPTHPQEVRGACPGTAPSLSADCGVLHSRTWWYVMIGPSATLMPPSGMLHLPPQQATAQHTSASTVVVKDSINNLKHEKLELVKKDFIHLMDSCGHEEAGKHFQPLPPSRFGDVTTSRLSQLRLWLKGYCLSRNVPLTDNFTTLFGRP